MPLGPVSFATVVNLQRESEGSTNIEIKMICTICFVFALLGTQAFAEVKNATLYALSPIALGSEAEEYLKSVYARGIMDEAAPGRVAGPETSKVEGQWDDAFVLPGPNFYVTAIAADDDAVYVAGVFDLAGSTPVQNIAMWSRQTASWNALGEGLGSDPESNPRINSIATGGGDTLFVAGEFSVSGDLHQAGAALWDGGEWRRIAGSGDGLHISKIASRFGVLYAGGTLETADSLWSGVLRWDDGVWTKATQGIDGRPTSVFVDREGQFYVGGAFQCEQDRLCGVAKYEEGQWRFFESYLANSGVLDPVVVSVSVKGDSILVSGIFDQIGTTPAHHIGLWNGTDWEMIGDESGNLRAPSAIDGRGNLYMIANGQVVHKWAGDHWEPLGGALPFEVVALEVFENEVFVGGVSAWNDEVAPAAYHMKWFDGDNWGVLGSSRAHGVSGPVLSLSGTPHGVYLGGRFEFAGTQRVNNIAHWDGESMSSVGGGLTGFVSALAFDGNDLYAGGFFTHPENADIKNIARWDGNRWHALDRGLDGPVNAILVRGSNVYVGGSFSLAFNAAGSIEVNNVAVWNGSEWSGLGGGTSAPVTALAQEAAGSLYAGGYFTRAGGAEANAVARWDGETWHALAGGFNRPVDALEIHDGALYAGGNFSEDSGAASNHVAKWDGAEWSPLGEGLSGDVLGFAKDSAGNLYAAGRFLASGSTWLGRVARWSGERWLPVGAGVMSSYTGYYAADIVAVNGDVYIGGRFEAVDDGDNQGSVPSANFARWIPSSSSNLGSDELTGNRGITALYPNPTSGRITVEVSVASTTHVVVALYDILGREALRLIDEVKTPGSHLLNADVSTLPSGVYFCRYRAGETAASRRMLLLR